MTVRRLDPVQPVGFSFSAENLSRARRAIAEFPQGKQASAVIQLLWFAQQQDGWISRASIEYVGKMLDMAYIRVLEVATFYTMFHLSPMGSKAHIQVCGTTPCMLRGAEDLIAVCKSKIHAAPHHLNADGSMSWEEVECLGSCVNAPMIQIVKDTYEDLTPERLSAIIDDFQAGRPVKPGPQNGRQFSMALTGATSLTEKSLYSQQRIYTRVEAPPPPSVAAVATAPVIDLKKPATPGAPLPADLTIKPPMAPVPAAEPVAPPVLTNSDAQVTARATAPVATPVAKAGGVPSEKTPTIKLTPAKAKGPELLKRPRGKADDLKLIKGIGPAFEKLLNKIGLWHFEQIASWTAADILHVDKLLKGFQGRIARDEWVRQAKKLAKGWRPENPNGERLLRKK